MSVLIWDSSASVCNQSTSVRLPKILLQAFSGSLHKWLSFKDIFSATIHQNKELLDRMKLQYLKSSFRSNTLGIIQSILIVGTNYGLACSVL